MIRTLPLLAIVLLASCYSGLPTLQNVPPEGDSAAGDEPAPGASDPDDPDPGSEPDPEEPPSDDDDAVDPPDQPALEDLAPLGQRRCDGMAPMATFDPSNWGPFPVGVKTLQLSDPLRGGRTLVTELWYPADASAAGGAGVSYGLGAGDIAALAGGQQGGMFAMLAMAAGDSDLLTIIETNAVREAPMAAADPDRGLVLFSHGFRGTRYQSTFLTTWLASHGYLVASPDHTGNTMFDGSEEPGESAYNRIFDLAFVLDEMIAAEADPANPLHGSFDPQRVATLGHSFGASTAINAGALDNREMVAVPLAPAFDARMAGVFNPPVYDLRSALFIVGGTEDTTTPWADQQLAWDRTVAPRFVTALDGARHFDFTDLCANQLLRYAFANFVEELSDACGPDPTAYHQTIQTLVTSALGRYLACEPSAAAELEPAAVEALPLIASYQPDPGAPIGLAPAEPPPAASTMPTTPAEHLVIQADGQEFTVTSYAGPDAAESPSLVFLHGLSTDARVFWPVVDALAAELPVLLVDLPGHGDSAQDPTAPHGADGVPGSSDDPYSIERWANGLDQVLLAAGASQSVIVGHSSGGEVAMSHYLQHTSGGSVAGLVLVGNAPLLQPDWLGHPDYNGGGTLEFARQLQTALAAGPGAGGEPWRPLARNFFAADPSPAQVDHLLDVMGAVPDETRLGQFLAPRPQLLGQLTAIDVPVLLVHGEQDDIHLSESSDYMLSVLPDATLSTFQRSGHMPFAEQPQAFAARLLEFIDTL